MPFLPTSAPGVRLVGRESDDQGSPGCTTAVPGPNGHVPPDACNSYYNYDPQFVPAVAVAVIFGLLTVVHLTEAFIFRKVSSKLAIPYAWVLIMGAAWETIAFILHSLGARDQQQVGYATGWQILFLLAPLWINAFVYMTFARLAWITLPNQRLAGVKPPSLAKYFVWADIVTFIVQAVGVYHGLAWCRCRCHPDWTGYLPGWNGPPATLHRHVPSSDDNFPPPCCVEDSGQRFPRRGPEKELEVITDCPICGSGIRNIYRIVEFAGGITPSNPVPFHEEYSYALDCFPMMLALLTLAVCHPGRTLVGPESEFHKRSRAEKKAEKQELKASKKQRKEEKNIRE
ncbi:Uu.00g036280.m01.CDS01 [Anthostomella pinea]|uniref:Uu.00g036280.m01.CDS01 n=1 Tax=Anthostomella pinea TaxID=933095 RepID=A0AAI8YDI4_9PEZI|nr:Uu.00g036280.m01.CDS01 [Anthostomella pinea]